MKNYDNIPQAIGRIRGSILISLLVLTLAYVGSLFSFYHLFIKDEKMAYSTFEACYFGMKKIVENDPSENLLNKSIIEDIEKLKDNFSVELLGQVKVLDPFRCDVFIKERRGTRRFQVTLEKNAKFPHLYKLLDVIEKKIDQEYMVL